MASDEWRVASKKEWELPLERLKVERWNVEETPHPRVFLAKSAETIEKKGVVNFESAKECART